MENDLNALGYVSSAPLLVDDEDTKPLHDEANLATLGEVLKLLRNRRKFYQSIDSIEADISRSAVIHQREVAVNKRVLFHLQEIETMVTNAIRKVEERQNG